MRVLIGCVVVHAVLASVVPSPWWLPDVTLIGLVLAVGETPGQWPVLSGVAGLFTILWTARFPGHVFLSYLICGWAIGALAHRWDADDIRVQSCLVMATSTAVTLGLVWFDHLWSLPVAGLAGARVAVTGCCVPLVRCLRDRFREAKTLWTG